MGYPFFPHLTKFQLAWILSSNGFDKNPGEQVGNDLFSVTSDNLKGLVKVLGKDDFSMEIKAKGFTVENVTSNQVNALLRKLLPGIQLVDD